MATLDIRVAASGDDVTRTDSATDITLVYNWLGYVSAGHGNVGTRYLNVTVPKNATIVTAYVTFTQEYNYTVTPCHLTTQGQASDNASVFISSTPDFDGRTRTSASVNWDAGGGGVDTTFNSDELKTVIQEIVNRSGWVSGNALVLFFKDNSSGGSAYRGAYSYNGSTTKAPLLHIEYSTTVTDTVTVGSSANIWSPNEIKTTTSAATIKVSTTTTTNSDASIEGRVISSDARTWVPNTIVTVSSAATITTSVTHTGTVAVRVAASGDDCDRNDVALSTTNIYIWLGQANNNHASSGTRFLNITVPKAALISSAYLTFTQEYNYTGTPCLLTTQGQAANNGATFSTKADYDGRALTGAAINWDAGGGGIDTTFNSADISTVIQEIVNRSGWVSGNALVLMTKDNGSASGNYRAPYSYDGSTTKAPLLHIDYITGYSDSINLKSDSWIYVSATSTISSNATIQVSETKTISSNGYIIVSETKTSSSTATIQVSETITIPSDTIIYVSGTATTTSNTDIQVSETKTISSDANIQALTNLATRNSDAIIFIPRRMIYRTRAMQ